MPLISLQQNNMIFIKYEIAPYEIFAVLYLIHLSEHFFLLNPFVFHREQVHCAK
jgi:hypothetical protein